MTSMQQTMTSSELRQISELLRDPQSSPLRKLKGKIAVRNRIKSEEKILQVLMRKKQGLLTEIGSLISLRNSLEKSIKSTLAMDFGDVQNAELAALQATHSAENTVFSMDAKSPQKKLKMNTTADASRGIKRYRPDVLISPALARTLKFAEDCYEKEVAAKPHSPRKPWHFNKGMLTIEIGTSGSVDLDSNNDVSVNDLDVSTFVEATNADTTRKRKFIESDEGHNDLETMLTEMAELSLVHPETSSAYGAEEKAHGTQSDENNDDSVDMGQGILAFISENKISVESKVDKKETVPEVPVPLDFSRTRKQQMIEEAKAETLKAFEGQSLDAIQEMGHRIEQRRLDNFVSPMKITVDAPTESLTRSMDLSAERTPSFYAGPDMSSQGAKFHTPPRSKTRPQTARSAHSSPSIKPMGSPTMMGQTPHSTPQMRPHTAHHPTDHSMQLGAWDLMSGSLGLPMTTRRDSVEQRRPGSVKRNKRRGSANKQAARPKIVW